MVATTEEINCSRTRTTHHQTARIIQWLGGERAVDVPAEFDRMPSIKEDYVDHQIASVKGECIELLRLKPLNKQTFDRGSLLRRSSIAHLNRSSSDAQTTADEAYCTLSSHRSGIQTQTNTNNNDLIRKGSSSGSSSLSTNAPICTSSPLLTISIDDIYATLDCAQTRFQMANDETMKNDIGRLREIAQQGSFQQSLHLLPIVTNSTECSMELFHEIMSTLDFNERDFQILMDDFVQLLERKLSDIELKMFDNNNTIRSSSPSLFDMLNDLKTCLTILRRTEMQSLLTVFDHVLKLRLFSAALPENETMMDKNEKKETSTNGETDEELLKLAQYGIDELKIVKIEKGFEPLGLTITRADSGSIHIARIVIGGMAANTQLFQIHDQILEINDEPVTGRPLQHICSLMANATGMIKFLLAPPAPSISRINSFQSSSFFVRALYAYDPQDDPLVPCKELGLAFQRGDILRIVARDENNNNNETGSTWWQAYRENSMETDTDPCLAGLIPSDNLQQKRAALFKAVSDDTQSISSSILKKKKPDQLFVLLV